MFYLRRINKKTGGKNNDCLGKSYSRIDQKDKDFQHFKDLADKFIEDVPQKGVHCIVIGTDAIPIPITDEYDSFIMTERGNTFERL